MELATESKKRNRNTIIFASVIFGFIICCCCITFSNNEDTTSNPEPSPTNNLSSPNQDQALQTAWAFITQTAKAIPTNTELPTQAITPTFTLQPVFTATLASSQLPATAACIKDPQPEIAQVVEVVDGDTIRVRLQDGLVYSLRYIGIDTPESTTAQEFYGKESSAKNSELVLNKEVLLFTDTTDKDRYGRLLRYVIADNTFINLELVAQGYATSVSYPPDTACQLAFTNAQQQATTSGLGFWAQPTPTLPPIGGQEQVCVCSGNAYNCSDFNTRSSAQACYNYCVAQGAGDVHKLDGNADGQACESLP